MMETEDDHDRYVAQLRDVFNSCDEENKGYLTRPQLLQLCARLQLEHHTDTLIETLIGDEEDAKVDFEEFKEGFVAVLSQTEEPDSSAEDDCQAEEETIPIEDIPADEDDKAKNTPPMPKRYGRRSLPDTDIFLTQELISPDLPSAKQPPTDPSLAKHSIPKSERRKEEGEDNNNTTEVDPETFEAEGQHGRSITPLELALDMDPISEEQHLRGIWRELGVGDDGFLTMSELSTVCAHIGMEEMNSEELGHLFNKLDADGDGRVSFLEFLQGLFQHGAPPQPNPSSRPHTPRPQSRQKLKLLGGSFEERTQTPSYVTIGSGYFSSIDPDGTGYATVDAILEYWETIGVLQGAEILEYLQIDLHNQVNLADLSFALEHEMRNIEEENATFWAAFATNQHELQYLKMENEHVVAERNKLQADLAESNNRIGILVDEGDERYSCLEKNRNQDIKELEMKYQEQLKALQSQLDSERELVVSTSARQHDEMETEIKRLKEEEIQLREKLLKTQKELEKLESEILEMTEHCVGLENQNRRQQEQLQSAAELQQRLEELESNRDLRQDEQDKFNQQKLAQLEAENQELKDKNDELKMEVEDLHQHAPGRPKHRHGRQLGTPVLPGWKGSPISGYIPSDTAENTPDSDPDEAGLSPRSRAVLGASPRPRPKEQALYTEKLQVELEEAKKERENVEEEYRNRLEEMKKEREDIEAKRQALQEQFDQDMERIIQEKEDTNRRLQDALEEQEKIKKELEAEIEALKDSFEDERKQIEHAFKLELADVEDQHRDEVDAIQDEYDREKEALQIELNQDHEAAMLDQMTRQKDQLDHLHQQELDDLKIKNESEKNLQEQNFAQEKSDMMERLLSDYEEDLKDQIEAQKRESDRRLQDAERQHEDELEELEKQIQHAKNDLEKERNKLSRDLRDKLAQLKKEQEEEKEELQKKHRNEIKNYENMFSQGEPALKGRLRDDFYALLEAKKDHDLGEEKARLAEKQDQENREKDHALAMEHAAREQELQMTIAELEAKLAGEKKARVTEVDELRKTLLNQYRHQVLDLERQLEDANERHHKECRALERQLEDSTNRHQKECSALERRVETMEDRHRAEMAALEEQMARERRQLERDRDRAREELQREITQDMKDGMEEEFLGQIDRLKAAFAGERSQLEARIQQLQDEIEERDRQRPLQDAKQQQAQQRQLEDKYQNKLDDLSRVNSSLQREKDTYKRLLDDSEASKRDLENALDQAVADKEEALRRRPSLIQRASSVPNAALPGNSTDRDKVILEAIASQKMLLEQKVGELKHQIVNLQKHGYNTALLQLSHDSLAAQKAALEDGMDRMQDRMETILRERLTPSPVRAVSYLPDNESDSVYVPRPSRVVPSTANEAVSYTPDRVNRDMLYSPSPARSYRPIPARSMSYTPNPMREAYMSPNLTRDVYTPSPVRDVMSYPYSLAKESSYHVTPGRDITHISNPIMDMPYTTNPARNISHISNSDKDISYMSHPASDMSHSSSPDRDVSFISNPVRDMSYSRSSHANNLMPESRHKNINEHVPSSTKLSSHISSPSNGHVYKSGVSKNDRILYGEPERGDDYVTMKEQLTDAEDRIAKAKTALALAEAEHLREIEKMRKNVGDMVDRTRYNNLNLKHMEAQRHISELEDALQQRAAESNRMIKGTHDDHIRAVRDLEVEKKESDRQLARTKDLLREHVQKLNEQLQKCTKSDMLVKDLYVENAQLMKTIHNTEKRQKDAYSRVYELEDKCSALQDIISDITLVALEE